MKPIILLSAALTLNLALVACVANAPVPDAEVPAAGPVPVPVAGDQGEAQPIVAKTTSSVIHPDWSRDAVIYQINTRQYSEAGTFDAVREDLPRIKDLGVDILWLMPIHPIGEEKRKGPLGSPYAVKDYLGVNPELGTLDDFKALVDAAQGMGMKVIIDWVANHTAWDNPLITEHPDWYTRDADGNMQHPPETDWEDVADLNFDNADLRQYMSDALVYWVEEVGIDGYRCDVAGMVPTSFWNAVRPRLDAVKPTFMLAEWQQPELHEHAFSATYAWRWKEIMQDIVKGDANAADLAGYYADYQSDWPIGAMRMAYTDNHDQNTWDGLPQDIYGDAYELAKVLSFTGEGIPLIYNGQECANPNSLEFFEKDPIVWNCDDPINGFLKDLVKLKTNNPALHNGDWGGRMEMITNDNPTNILSFVRRKGDNTVVFVANLSDQPQSFSFLDELPHDVFTDMHTERTIMLIDAEHTLPPWDYRVFTRG